MAQNLIFNVFPCGAREWCACRADGLVCGYFVDQEGAVRFARRETCGVGAVIVRSTMISDRSLGVVA